MNFVRNVWAAPLILILTPIVVVIGVVPASARDNGQWTNVPENIRQWFQSLKQPDHPRLSCCGEADAFEADSFEGEGNHYVAIITDGKGVIPNGTRIAVPNQKMKWDAGNPTGHGIIFIGPERQVYCYDAGWAVNPDIVAHYRVEPLGFVSMSSQRHSHCSALCTAASGRRNGVRQSRRSVQNRRTATPSRAPRRWLSNNSSSVMRP